VEGMHPSKHARFGIKSFKLCEAKCGYICNFIIYIGQDTIFDESLKNEPYSSKLVLQLSLLQGCHSVKAKSMSALCYVLQKGSTS
jgi:hypothetical protein